MPSAVLISQLPKFVLREEHQAIVASTPASFADIPAMLKHLEPDVSVTLDPPLEGFSTEDGANGSLVLVFFSAAGRGFQIEYPAITLHAVSRAESGPSIYCQLDDGAGEQTTATDDDAMEMRELVIVPKNAGSLDAIFEALSVCAALHPDKRTDSDDEMDGGDDAFIDASNSPFETFTGDGDEELSEVGRAALAHLESIIHDPYEKKEETEGEPKPKGVNGA